MSSPAWSPDGTEVAFSKFVPDPGNGGCHTAIFIAKHDGTGVRQLTTPREFRPDTCEPSCSNVGVWADHSPTWSPDGTKVAFIRIAGIGEEAGDYGERGHDIFVTTPAGGAPQRLTSVTDTGIHNGLAWSPDGTQLATTWVPEKAQPYLAAISAAGGGRSKLAQVTGSPMDFDWAPDGKSIALSYVTPGGFKAGIAEQRRHAGHRDDQRHARALQQRRQRPDPRRLRDAARALPLRPAAAHDPGSRRRHPSERSAEQGASPTCRPASRSTR